MKNQLKFIILKNLKTSDELFIDKTILIPVPKEISLSEEKKTFFLTSESNIYFANVNNSDLFIDDLNEFLKQISNIRIAGIKDKGNNLEKKLRFKDLLDIKNEEGYNLEINNNEILIYGIHEKGLFYGLQTLILLLKNGYLIDVKIKKVPAKQINRIILPKIEIRDVPDLKMRGIAQDISRGQVFTVENAKRYIKILSHYKMNYYFLYIEDVYAHPKYPSIGKDRGALTRQEIKEIDEFAKQRFIDLVPIFECLGHVDNILQHEEYEDLGEFPSAHSLSISNPNIYEFLEDYISELSDCFSTKYFHIGCDESFDMGRYNSKDYFKNKGKSEALIEFYEKVYHIAKNNGNDYVIMYDDIVRKHEDVLKNLNKNLILMYWDYAPKKKFPYLEKFLEAGYKVIISPSMLNWQRNFPDNKNASKNIINFIKTAYEYRNAGCLGVLTSTWGDMRYYSFRENEIFGAILNGAIAWTTLNFNYRKFKLNYGFLFYGIEKASLEEFNEMFSLLSNSSSFYYRLSILLPPLFFTYFFKHPFPKKEFHPPIENYQKIEDLSNKCLYYYKELKSKVQFEIENFEYIEFAAELGKYLKEKISISQKISNILNKSEVYDIDVQTVISDIDYIKDKIEYLKNKYEKLWLRAAKRPCLDNILNLFDFLINAYEKKISQVKARTYFEDPYLPSEWIWTPDTSDTSNSTKPRYFRKEINIKYPIKKAIIQGIAGNQMKIYINNEYIGQVLSRYSMSILPIVLRVRTFDVTEYLKAGENVIAIEAHNFEGNMGAINIYGQILLEDDTLLEFITDTTWLCSSNKSLGSNDWKKTNFGVERWEKPQSYGRPPNLNGDIFKPNLLKGEISDTQDYFGIAGYLSNFIGNKENEKIDIENVINNFKPYGN